MLSKFFGKKYNVKKGDMAVVVSGMAAGWIVQVGKFIPNDSFWYLNGRKLHVGEGDSWECTTKGTPIPFKITNKGSGVTQNGAAKTAPIVDAALRPIKGLSDDEIIEAAREAEKDMTLAKNVVKPMRKSRTNYWLSDACMRIFICCIINVWHSRA